MASAKLELKEGTQPDFSTGIRYGGRIEDEAVRRDAAGLLSRFSLISMVSHIEQHAQLLLLQRRVIEEMVSTGQRLDSKSMWKILRGVHKDSLSGPVKLCSELVVKEPSIELASKMNWLDGIVRVRNCLAHRLGYVQMQDVRSGKPIEEIKDSDTLKAIWLRLKVSDNGKVIETFPHISSGKGFDYTFEEFKREWRIGDHIDVTPEECQAIGISLALLANQLLDDFEREINIFLSSTNPSF